ncbi:MAG: hypothetical protein K9M07_01635 [Simkaniaceae bacterium]|nr:hypothetical protein [Simkaniaceae bacterium]MCF7851923.1 hypothetical protein [Simkaniaceae bacterium]
MLSSLKNILDIQELDVKMIRLIRLKRQRQKELTQIEQLTSELRLQLSKKEEDIETMNREINELEEKIIKLKEKIKSIEAKQSEVKKIDEFNALTQELALAGREKTSVEHNLSNLVDKKMLEEEILEKIKVSLSASEASGKEIEAEINANIREINVEGQALKIKRDDLAKDADPVILAIYERLMKNKKNRVLVPIENRTCSGCHIALTAQHENLVRKGENLTFCEHCSRIHYWQEAEDQEADKTQGRRRRRRAAAV